MSLANFYDINQNQIIIPSLDAMNLEINNIPFNGSGGNSNILNITSSDGSVNITNTSGTVNITNAGQNWSNFQSINEVNMNGNNFLNLSGFSMQSFSTANNLTLYQGFSGCSGLNGMYLTDGAQGGAGNVGNVYDSKFNPPTLSDCLIASTSAGGYDITEIGKLSCGTSLSIGNLSISNVSGILNITNGVKTGKIYDSVINVPPSSIPYSQYRQVATIKNVLSSNWTNYGSDGSLSTLYTFDLTQYPNCRHFTLNLSELDILNTEGQGTLYGISLYLMDTNTMPSNGMQGYTNSLNSVALPSTTFNNNNVSYTPTTTPWIIEYGSQATPANLYLMAFTSNSLPTLEYVNIYFNLEADTSNVVILNSIET